jgi:osmotically-inducible protein OsmY
MYLFYMKMKFYLIIEKLIILFFLTYCLSSCVPAAIVAVGAGAVQVQKDTTIGQTIDQNILSSRVKAALLSYCPANWRYLFLNISVVTQGNTVYLTGTLDDSEQITKAIEIAWEEKGVEEVVSGLKISEDSKKFNLKQYAIDTSITTAIKTRILFSKGIKSANYTIFTFNDVVHIFGVARSSQERDKVHDIAASNSGVEEVVSHIKLIQP